MNGRRGQRELNSTERNVQTLFDIGRSIIRGEQYNFAMEFFCEGLVEAELDRMVDSGELFPTIFIIVMKGYDALVEWRHRQDEKLFGEYSSKDFS